MSDTAEDVELPYNDDAPQGEKISVLEERLDVLG